MQLSADVRRCCAVIVSCGLALAACMPQAVSTDEPSAPVLVRDAAQLLAALQPENAGRRIELAAGEYAVDRALVVPDGATLAGAGVMQVDGEGMPRGFVPGTASTLVVDAGFEGNVLTLGHGSALVGLRVVDAAGSDAQPRRLRRNVVYVGSRAPGDTVNASIVECELENFHDSGFSEEGPHGHGLVALTNNPSLGQMPPAHESAQVSVRVQRSIVRTGTGAAIFGINFAAHGSVNLRLVENRFEGHLVLGGGVSRPDAVTGAVATIESRRNLYKVAGWRRAGWLLIGGSTPAHYLEPGIPGASGNLLLMDSTDDRIDGFRSAIEVAAARRLGAQSSPLSDNRVELRLQGTRIAGPREGADLVLRGAWSESEPWRTPGEFPAGDRNVLAVTLRDVTGSGRAGNVYADIDGPVQPANAGIGNRLIIEGTPEQFRQSNRGIEPEPAARFFGEAR